MGIYRVRIASTEVREYAIVADSKEEAWRIGWWEVRGGGRLVTCSRDAVEVSEKVLETVVKEEVTDD